MQTKSKQVQKKKAAKRGSSKNEPSKSNKASKASNLDSINDQDAWLNMQKSWLKEKASITQANFLARFDTDDDMPLSKHLLLFTITGFFALFVLWAQFATIEEVTRGEGKIVPSSEVQALQTLEAGIVEEFLIQEGQEVKKDQVLVRLSDIEAGADLGANQARYFGLLAAIRRLQAEAEGQLTVDFPEEVKKGAPNSVSEELNAFRANNAQLQGQTNILDQQRAQREQEVREINTRARDIRETIRLQRQEIAMIEPLVAQGSAPKLELLQLERSLQEKQSELNSIVSGIPRARAAIDEVKARIEEIKSSTQAQAQTELAVKLIELNEIKERLAALKERKTRTELKSPVNGIIQELSINTIGGVVRPGEDIIKIVPKDDQLIVEAKVRPSDRAFIYPGQEAIVKLTTYDFSIYGGLQGELLSISADTFEDEQGESFYRVRLRTLENELKRKGEVLPIEIGMVANVDILTGKKTVMEYLLKPFNKTLENALRER